jgi:hypothetical protein
MQILTSSARSRPVALSGQKSMMGEELNANEVTHRWVAHDRHCGVSSTPRKRI